MQAIFRPKRIALIGASEREGALGSILHWNLTHCGFKGEIFYVNPRYQKIGDQPCYKRVCDIPVSIDLALIVTPATIAGDVIRDCCQQQIKGAVVFSRDFYEGSLKSIARRLRLLEEARAANLRLLGPNSIGFMAPHFGLNASVRRMMPSAGNVGFVSQSGALGTSMLDMSAREKIGFSAFISVGMLDDLDWSDLIYFLGDDPDTQTIILHVDTIKNPRRFISAAREVSYRKPIIALRTGTLGLGGQRWEGNLTGDDRIFDAVFRRSGILRVRNVAELFSVAGVFSKQVRPQGKRLAILTNSGGMSLLAADALLREGGELASPGPQTHQQLNQVLPEGWHQSGIVDLQNQSLPEEFEQALNALSKDPQNDGILLIFAPQAIVNATQIAGKIKQYNRIPKKPLLTCFIGGREMSAANDILNTAQIPTLPYPDTAAHIFNYMWKYEYNKKTIYQTPRLTQDEGLGIAEKSEIEDYITALRGRAVTQLAPENIQHIFSVYQIKGQRDDLPPPDPEELHFDIQIGSQIDPLFGPFVFAGYGGPLGNVFNDIAIGLPPLNLNLVQRMLEQTQVFRAMVKTHLPSEVIDDLEELIARLGRLVVEQRMIARLHLPSVSVTPEGVSFKQVLCQLHPSDMRLQDLPRLAIRPYPTLYEQFWKMKNDQAVLIRPIRPEDEPLLVTFHESLSNQSVYFRYFNSVSVHQRTSHERLARICFIDYDQEMALVAERRDTPTSKHILGVARLRRISGTRDAEYAILVQDDAQRTGLGTELLRRIMDIAQQEGITRLLADILPENQGMRRISEKLGFRVRYDLDEGVLKADYTFPVPK